MVAAAHVRDGDVLRALPVGPGSFVSRYRSYAPRPGDVGCYLASVRPVDGGVAVSTYGGRSRAAYRRTFVLPCSTLVEVDRSDGNDD